jgi:hypothetical protein
MMSKHIRFYMLILVAVTTLLPIACKDDDGDAKTVTEQQAEKLTGHWKVTTVTLDGANREGYEETTFHLSSLTAGTNMRYIIDNNAAESPWRLSAGGRLFFDTQEPTTYLTREDEVRIAYEVTETTLVFEFTYAEPSTTGRVNGVVGEWNFVLVKQ